MNRVHRFDRAPKPRVLCPYCRTGKLVMRGAESRGRRMTVMAPYFWDCMTCRQTIRVAKLPAGHLGRRVSGTAAKPNFRWHKTL